MLYSAACLQLTLQVVMGCLSMVASGLAQLAPGRPPCCLAVEFPICYISISESHVTPYVERGLVILVMLLQGA